MPVVLLFFRDETGFARQQRLPPVLLRFAGFSGHRPPAPRASLFMATVLLLLLLTLWLGAALAQRKE